MDREKYIHLADLLSKYHAYWTIEHGVLDIRNMPWLFSVDEPSDFDIKTTYISVSFIIKNNDDDVAYIKKYFYDVFNFATREEDKSICIMSKMGQTENLVQGFASYLDFANEGGLNAIYPDIAFAVEYLELIKKYLKLSSLYLDNKGIITLKD